MALVKTKGLVIRESPFQEQDKMLTLFTLEGGKVKAIAKGVRRSKSGMVAATQLFAYSEFVYYPGKNFAMINSAELIEAFYPLRQDLVLMALASCVLELLDVFYDFYQGRPDILRLANHILYYLSTGKAATPSALVAAFQLKLSEAQGIRPILGKCARCGADSELVYFGVEEGGAVCRSCSSALGYTYRLLPEQLAAMQTLMVKPVTQLRDMTFSDEMIRRIMDVMDHYIAFNLDKRMKAYSFYKELTGG